MTKKEIEEKLRANWIFKKSGLKDYEEAKRVIMEDLLEISDPKEYERRIFMIINYLEI